MPIQSRFLVRTALLYLVVGFTLGGLLLANKGYPLSAAIWGLRPLHAEILVMGWMVQFIMGVAYWILPRWHTSRGHPLWAWGAYGLLNLGILLLVLVLLLDPSQLMLRILARLAELAGIGAFLLNAWPRVKPLGA